MLFTALPSGQLPPLSAMQRAQFSQNRACPHGTKAKPSIGASRHTSQHRNGVSEAAALLAPTLRPTRWQQSVSTARRRRNCRRVGCAVARRCERQRRGSQHARTAMCRTHHCDKSMRANACIQSYMGIVWGNWSNSVIDSIYTYTYKVSKQQARMHAFALVQLRHFPVRHFRVRQIPPSVLGWSVIFHSCKFQSPRTGFIYSSMESALSTSY